MELKAVASIVLVVFFVAVAIWLHRRKKSK